MNSTLPLIGVCADVKTIDEQSFHAVGDKYLRAIAEAAMAMPLVVPALDSLDIADLVNRLDGVFLTGSLSNLHPSRYGVEPTREHEPYDLNRDELVWRLIEQTQHQQVPLLAVCRGFQELNAALGGTLHPALHTLPNRLDHRCPESADRTVQYGPKHKLRFNPGGLFHKIVGELEIAVNSLHQQGIDQLAPGLQAEGWAPDGLIEAVSILDAPTFALGAQWHPEYKAAQNPHSLKLFQAFGAAARMRAEARWH